MVTRWPRVTGAPAAERIGTPGTTAKLAGRAWLRLAVVAAVCLGFAVRAAYFVGADFPLNDGGLFFAMGRDLEANGFALPAFTSYNGGSIPFAYPPLGIYLAAALRRATGTDLELWFRVLPLALSCLEILAFARLCRALVEDERVAAVAVAAFALLPIGFGWLIMGGGVTRALGAVGGLLTLHAVVLVQRRGGPVVVLAGAAAALTVMSHLEWALFVAYSAPLVWWWSGRHPAAVGRLAAVAALGAGLSAPWWLAVASRHGLDVFVRAGTATADLWPFWQRVLPVLRLDLTAEPLAPLVMVLAVVGAVVAVARGRRFPVVWFALMFVVDTRGTALRLAFPLAMLAGVGAVDGLFPLARRAFGAAAPAGLPARRTLGRWALTVSIVVAVLANAVGSMAAWRSIARPLPGGEREAMAWVERATPASSAFVVVSVADWTADSANEWLPALTGRRSLTTVQGHEWLGAAEVTARIERAAAVRRCFADGDACPDRLPGIVGAPFSHVYLPLAADTRAAAGDPTLAAAYVALARSALARHPDYRLVYDGPGAAIFAYRGGAVSSGAAAPASLDRSSRGQISVPFTPSGVGRFAVRDDAHA